jgi:hypothetical protein
VRDHDLCELECGVFFAGLEPMDGDTQPWCELSERAQAWSPRVAFDSADVRERDAYGRELSLA